MSDRSLLMTADELVAYAETYLKTSVMGFGLSRYVYRVSSRRAQLNFQDVEAAWNSVLIWAARRPVDFQRDVYTRGSFFFMSMKRACCRMIRERCALRRGCGRRSTSFEAEGVAERLLAREGEAAFELRMRELDDFVQRWSRGLSEVQRAVLIALPEAVRNCNLGKDSWWVGYQQRVTELCGYRGSVSKVIKSISHILSPFRDDFYDLLRRAA